jgi:hypothetical protein
MGRNSNCQQANFTRFGVPERRMQRRLTELPRNRPASRVGDLPATELDLQMPEWLLQATDR